MKRLNLIDKAFLLKRTSVFTSLDLDLLLAIADKLEVMTVPENESIFLAGQTGNKLYLIAKGSVRLESIEGAIFGQLSTPAIFGDEALFNEKPRMYHAITEVETILLTLSRTHLATIISESPNVALGFLQEYANAFPCRFKSNEVEAP